MENKENTLPVTIGEMIAALRNFSQHCENEYELLILTESAAELEKVQEARRRAVRLAQYVPQQVKVKKLQKNDRLDAMVYALRRHQEEKDPRWKVCDDCQRIICETCGYKFHSEAVSKLPDCNTCGKRRSCEYVPRLGAYTRPNCPHWEAEQNGGGDHE